MKKKVEFEANVEKHGYNGWNGWTEDTLVIPTNKNMIFEEYLYPLEGKKVRVIIEEIE